MGEKVKTVDLCSAESLAKYAHYERMTSEELAEFLPNKITRIGHMSAHFKPDNKYYFHGATVPMHGTYSTDNDQVCISYEPNNCFRLFKHASCDIYIRINDNSPNAFASEVFESSVEEK